MNPLSVSMLKGHYHVHAEVKPTVFSVWHAFRYAGITGQKHQRRKTYNLLFSGEAELNVLNSPIGNQYRGVGLFHLSATYEKTGSHTHS